MKTNARKFSAAILELARIPSQVSAQAARDLSKEIQRNFDRGVDPFGKAWKPLAKSTIAKGRRAPPLTDTGEGRRSVVVRPAVGAGIQITVGLVRMLYHQFGGASHLRGRGGSYKQRHTNKRFGTSADLSSRRGNPPKRSFLPFDEMPERWIQIYQASLDTVLAKLKVGRSA